MTFLRGTPRAVVFGTVEPSGLAGPLGIVIDTESGRTRSFVTRQNSSVGRVYPSQRRIVRHRLLAEALPRARYQRLSVTLEPQVGVALHDTARGYEPSTRNSEARFLSAASALATCTSSAWPTMSKKNT